MMFIDAPYYDVTKIALFVRDSTKLAVFCWQEKATKWETGVDMDGLTTNGVLIMHPNGSFSDGNGAPGIWREVSVCGAIYSLRVSRSAAIKGNAVRPYE